MGSDACMHGHGLKIVASAGSCSDRSLPGSAAMPVALEGQVLKTGISFQRNNPMNKPPRKSLPAGQA